MKTKTLCALCLLISAVLACSGCVKYTTNFGDSVTQASGEEYSTAEPVTYYVPATDEAGEEVTDSEGSQVYIEMTEAPSVITDTTAADSETTTEKKSVFQSIFGKKDDEETTAKATEKATSSSNSTVTTTVASGKTTENTTASGKTSSETTTAAASSGVNQYDVFRSGTFYAKGSMKDADGTNPLEIAITPNSIYMVTKFESVDMGILVSSGKTYLMYPAEKTYLEMSSTVMSMMGLDTDELISSDDLGFTDLEPLSQASSKTEGTFNGTSCTVYTFNNDDSTQSKVYMNGNTLLGLETVSGGTVASATYIDYITGTVPADKISPPSDYTKSGIWDFMSLLSDVME